jgi:hypothetical protein
MVYISYITCPQPTLPAKNFFIREDYSFNRHSSELVHILEKARMTIL